MDTTQHELQALLTKEVGERLEQAIRGLRARHGSSLLTHEILNEGFLRAVRSFQGRWNSREHFYGYLYRAIHSFLVDYQRRKATEKHGARPCSIDFLVEHGHDPECRTVRLPLAECNEIVETTPPEYRDIVLAFIYAQEDAKATSERLGVPLSRVKTVRRRFRQRLEAHLGITGS